MRKKRLVSTAAASRPAVRRATALAAVAVVAVALGGMVALALGVPWGSSTGSASPNGSLSCSVKASCGAGEVAVLRMSSLANAHAGTASGSSYPNVVCCGGVAGLGTNCGATPHAVALSLWAADNAHAASDGSYGTDVCVSGYGDDATADVAYGASCDVGYACLATISGSTNAHVADCDGVDDYATKVCGLVTPDNCPSTPNAGQENADGDQWGDACENCPAVATVWWVPEGDGDCDAFTDADEGVIGTDPADPCPDTPDPNDEDPDPWPPDFNDDRLINIVDLNKILPPPLGSWGSSPGNPDVNGDTIPDWTPRRDIVPDGVINISDLNKTLPPPLGAWGVVCTP